MRSINLSIISAGIFLSSLIGLTACGLAGRPIAKSTNDSVRIVNKVRKQPVKIHKETIE